ncbi:hypothetical protein C7B61_21635 [filamentous cyanobacterium CCP1]|nr:hypothetical protein C7B61_21635 [filamentous cyanobacterium CCP1]
MRSTWLWRLAGIGIVPLVLSAGSVGAAEYITLTYRGIERSISVESFEIYAQTGEISSDLREVTRFLSQQQLNDLRQILLARADFTPTAVSQFLYTDQGEILLRRLGEMIRTEANLSGFYAIRSALILAAADPEDGLPLVNVLKEFPLNGLRVDLTRSLQILGGLEDLITQTQDALALIQEQAALEAEFGRWIVFDTLPDLRLAGSLSWEVQSIVLTDERRDALDGTVNSRSFPVDVYLPRTKDNEPISAAPVIVISHGLGSDRTTYAYLAQHLVTYGFVVVVPEHPGSNSQQLQALISGRASQVTSPSEFIDRPLDITHVLDELAELAQSDPVFAGRLNVQQVGVIGQSLGGYTALVLAGAQINFAQLEAECTENTFNLSLLLQCRALDLPSFLPDLQDERVKAVIAINPIGSSLLGEEDYGAIQTPVMIISGSADTIAPALPEQIRPFTWLQTPDRFLVIFQGGTHFSTIDVPHSNRTPSEIVQLPSQIVGPDPALAHTYLRSLSLAFLGTYIAQDSTYQPFLNPAYAQQISEASMPVRLVRSLTSTQLSRALNESVIELVTPPSIGSGADEQQPEM